MDSGQWTERCEEAREITSHKLTDEWTVVSGQWTERCEEAQMDIKSYKDMIVWQKSMDLAIEIYKLVKLLPKEEIYALSDQMRRAAVSIPSNIAEGQSRNKTKEFIQFLSIARGSNSELFTQLLICEKVGYLSENQTLYAKSASSEISKMLVALINKLSAER